MKKLFSNMVSHFSLRKRFNEGVGLIHRKQFREACVVFTGIVQDRPDYYEAWYHLGVIQDQLKNPEVAADCLKTALKFNPRHTATVYLLGSLAYRQNNIPEAVCYLQQAVKFDNGHAGALNLYGLCRRDEGNPLEAIGCFQRGLKSDPQNRSILFNLATTYLQIKEYDRAIEHYNRLIAIQPDYTEAYINLAAIYRERKNRSSEIQVWRALQKQYPEDPAVKEMLNQLK